MERGGGALDEPSEHAVKILGAAPAGDAIAVLAIERQSEQPRVTFEPIAKYLGCRVVGDAQCKTCGRGDAVQDQSGSTIQVINARGVLLASLEPDNTGGAQDADDGHEEPESYRSWEVLVPLLRAHWCGSMSSTSDMSPSRSGIERGSTPAASSAKAPLMMARSEYA
jgi:hypothetical protein